jgi:small nuclear ribonucleoprotein (snRNP)-like protein
MKSDIFNNLIYKTISVKFTDGTYLTGIVSSVEEDNAIIIKTLTDNFYVSCNQIISFKILEDRK